MDYGTEFLLAIFGANGVVIGLIVYIAKKYIDRSFSIAAETRQAELKAEEEERAKLALQTKQYNTILLEMSKSRNTINFWLSRGIRSIDPDLKHFDEKIFDAFAGVEKAEEKMNALQGDIFIDNIKQNY